VLPGEVVSRIAAGEVMNGPPQSLKSLLKTALMLAAGTS